VPHFRQLLCASLATGLLLHSGTAQARFGKSSNSSSSSSSSSDSTTHDATPVGSSDSGSSSGGSSGGGSSGSGSYSGHGGHRGHGGSDAVRTVGAILDVVTFIADVANTAEQVSAYEATVEATTTVNDDGSPPIYPYSYQPPVAEQQQVVEEGNRNKVLVRFGVEGQALGEGSALGVNLGIEGQIFGVSGAVNALSLAADDGTAGVDRIGLYSGHLTFAMYSSDHGRLRGELGMSIARAPDATFVGPSVGVSFEHCLVGALDVESRGQLVIIPYRQVDGQAGLAVHLGPLTVRGGWRVTMLDDAGLVDGQAHRDYFSGPYAGLGLNI
jgi:hypothetical protein